MNYLLFFLITCVQSDFFLQITDPHLDLLYSPNSPNNCYLLNSGLGCCRKFDIPKNPYHKANAWGDLHCDIPYKLLNETLKYISHMKIKFDFVLFTGDIVDHHFFSDTMDKNLQTMKDFYQLLNYYFQHINVYPCLGNHDTWPLDQLAAPSKYSNFLMDFIKKEWAHWLDENALKTASYSGYYTMLLNKKLRLVVINSLYYDSHNILIDQNKDNGEQFKWLNNTLQSAKKNNETVWLVGHIPPTDGEATPYFINNIKHIIKIYNHTILYQFWGHTHKDEFIVYPENIAFGFGCPSLMSDHRNPSFRVYEYNSTTNEIINYYHYTINLTDTIIKNKLNVTLLYDFKHTYHLDKINGYTMGLLAHSFKNNKDMFKKYCDLYYNTPEKYTCSNELINNIFV